MREMKIRVAFVLAFAIGLTGCGGNNSGNSLASPSGMQGMSLRSAQRIAMSSHVECENPQECNEAVGMLVYVTSDGNVEACTASVIAPDMVMTNSHCIPTDLKAGLYGATSLIDCQDRLWIFLPATAHRQNEVLNCRRIVGATNVYPGSLGTDLGFIATTPTVRHPLTVSSEGLPNQLALQLQKVDPVLSDKGYKGTLKVQTCKVAYGTVAFPELHDSKTSIMTLKGCQSSGGNSGSPLLDEGGSARAVLQAVHQPRVFALDDADGVQQIPIASNLACTTGSSTCFSYPDSDVRVTEAFEKANAQIREMTDEAIESAYRSWAGTTQVPILFDQLIDASSGTQPVAKVAFKPKCLINRWMWVAHAKDERLTILTPLLVEIRVEFGIDETFRFIHRDKVDTKAVNFTFNPKQLLATGSSPYSAVSPDGKFRIEGTLPACDPQP